MLADRPQEGDVVEYPVWAHRVNGGVVMKGAEGRCCRTRGKGKYGSECEVCCYVQIVRGSVRLVCACVGI
jgi:hypothetical protein